MDNINTFGDDFFCESENPQRNCHFNFTSSRNSCGFLVEPKSYKDIFKQSNGSPKQCVGDLLLEPVTNPSGITNIASAALAEWPH